MIIGISGLLLVITGLSLTGIVTNMRMRGGGSYYLISRSLGLEFGSAIGILTCISQHVSIALCITGFALSLYEIFPIVPLWTLKAGTLTTLVVISYISTNLALRTQALIFITLAVAIGSIFFGFSPAPEGMATVETPSLSFWMGFAMFFPAMSGIEAGMSMSGDLRKPSRSIPIGTMAAIFVVVLTYEGIALFLSANVSSDLLRSHPFILFYTSKMSYLVILGVWAATLSSAMGAILGGPRIMQAVAKDGILPKFLSKGFGPTNQPRVATLVVSSLAMVLTVATDINQIIPILTMACLVSYGLINFIAFFEAFMQNPSWRPAIKIPWVLPLVGGIGCFMAMLMINPGATFIVGALVIGLFLWTTNRKIKGNWDDLKHSIFSFFVHKGTIKLSSLKSSAKSWRPHILTILDFPVLNKNLAFFSHALNQERGFLTIGTSVSSEENAKAFYRDLKEDLRAFKIPSHIHINRCMNPVQGADQIIKNYGFGLLKPNTVILPFPEKFEINAFIELLLDTHAQEKNIIILKDDPQKDYLFNDSSRKGKQINLWWRGKYPGNFELCLALAYLLQQGKLWPKSKICIKMVTQDEERKQKFADQFIRYKQKLRIRNLHFSPLVDTKGEFFPCLQQNSQDASLTFLGLKRPNESMTAEEYKDYYLRLLENTKGLNNIAYVLCGEKVKFRKIFL